MIWTSDELRRCRANGCHLMLDVIVVIVEAEWRFGLHSGFRVEECSRRERPLLCVSCEQGQEQ